jgi:hypothetical protein
MIHQFGDLRIGPISVLRGEGRDPGAGIGRNPAAAIEGAGDRHLAHARDGGELAQG